MIQGKLILAAYHHLGTSPDERWVGQKLTGEERGGSTRVEGAAPGGKAGGLGGEAAVAGERGGFFVLGVALSAVLPFRSGDADVDRPITWETRNARQTCS